MKKTIYSLFLLCLTGSMALAQQAALKTADVLQSNMVIQQNKPFKVWGTAAPGTVISINADWTGPISVTTGKDGNFTGVLNVPKINPGDYTKHTITLKGNDNEVTLENLLIGDVWFCSGQSNMQFKLQEDTNAVTELPAANNPNIRVFNADLNFSAVPLQHIKGKWLLCTPENVKNFTAVGYYFGKSLQEKLNIPVGVIFSGIGASKVEAFIPQEALAGNPVLDSSYLQPYLKSPKSKEVINGGFSFEKVTRPFLLYNALINPFVNLSIKGFCWYQGEGNRMERDNYTLATQTLIKTWRENFGQGDLPFYYVQVAPFFYDKEDPTMNDYAFFREAQEKIGQLNNTEMVVSMDVGEAKNLHPKNKRPLGIRLAKTALNRVYGMDTVTYRGPKYQHMEIKGKTVTLFFEPGTIKNGLTTNDHKDPEFFMLAGPDKIFYPAKSKITGNTIVLSSDKVKQPVAARYAFTNYPVTNLQNGAGLPALPFRTDNWPEKQ